MSIFNLLELMGLKYANILEYLNDLPSLNTLWISLGLTGFSFLSCLKIIFFLIFIFLNIFLFYIESLDRKYKNINNPESHLKSSPVPELIKISNSVIIGIGVLSGIITIRNEYKHQVNLEN